MAANEHFITSIFGLKKKVFFFSISYDATQ